MNSNEKYNVVVIGAGTAGLVTAAGTAGLGGRVALIERNKMGGDCLNFGCVPSKALISSARAIQNIRRAEQWGLKKHEPQFEFHEVFERMRARRAKIAPNDSKERFEGLGVDVFLGQAKFLSPHEVEVDGKILRAKNFVIAAGSRAGAPPVDGLKEVKFYTNETIFDELREKPKSMAVVGGGPIGCELSQVLQRLGVQMTIIEYGPQLLLKEDRDVADFMQERLEAEGVRVIHCAETKRVFQKDGCVHFELLRKPPGDSVGTSLHVEADALLVAAGRIPNVEGLNLEAAGVKYSNKGVEVNEYLQTSQPHIYAAGDIVGPYQFTHTADFQARTVARNILLPFAKSKMNYSVVPWCTYTDPEVAHVGLNETEAKAQGIEYDLFTQPMEDVDRAILESEDQGFAKVLTRKGTDKILGVTLVASHAGDLLHEFVLAMKYDIGLSKIAATIHAYPTFAELARKSGDKYQKTRLTPLAKTLFAWLYRRARR
jgi:pyruvate/2-oxoglutarate dehydrogenase complex dihydrolipoamide dehydrogenase (E3) component